MITIMFTKHELLLVDLLPQGQSFNCEYFISNVMIPTLQRFQEVTGRKKAKLHLDNCRVHNSKKSYEWYNLNHIIRIPHPPYSPDLAPSDFFCSDTLRINLLDDHLTVQPIYLKQL